MLKIFSFLFKVILIFILPFILLIRGAVYLHQYHDTLPIISLAGGVLFATLTLFIYLSIIYSKITKKFGDGKSLKKRLGIAILLVGAYSTYALFFLNSKNLKNQSLKSEILELHPILRLATSTLTYIDKDLIITDASRTPEDYTKMGLKKANNSLHYPQKDGNVYALDLRTKNRSAFQNQATTYFFKLMGFRTLRHIGTDDHLHISLYCKYKKGGI